MFYQFSIAAAGFSVVVLILLAFQKRAESKIAARLARTLLMALTATQLIQLMHITDYIAVNKGFELIYLVLLGLVGPLFYLYSQYVIRSELEWSIYGYMHFIPVAGVALLALAFPGHFGLLYSLVFLLGGVYMAYLCVSLFQLRARRSLFKMEFIFSAVFLSWAVAVVVVGLFAAQMLDKLVLAQIIMLAVAIAGALHIQLNYPHLLSSLEELVSQKYQTSTLLNVDCDEVKKTLKVLFSEKRIFEDIDLSLSGLAEMLSVKPHQLSELMNTQLGVSFTSYLRGQRVEAAKQMLKDEPEASVLAIGLACGFRSQSAFYSAFKETYNMAPGQYRNKL